MSVSRERGAVLRLPCLALTVPRLPPPTPMPTLTPTPTSKPTTHFLPPRVHVCYNPVAVHRLDCETSGVMAMGLAKDVAEELNRQFRDREGACTSISCLYRACSIVPAGCYAAVNG